MEPIHMEPIHMEPIHMEPIHMEPIHMFTSPPSLCSHIYVQVSGAAVWQPMRQAIVAALNKQKVPNTLNILATEYISADVVCLQEVSAAFIDEANGNAKISERFHVVAPHELDGKRDQNSCIFLSKAKFPDGDKAVEITADIEANFPKGVKVPVAKGDIIALNVADVDGNVYVIASFHGDTNGLATIPVLTAFDKTVGGSGKKLIFGMDANTYEKVDLKKRDKQDVGEFGEFFVGLGYSSNQGDVPDRTNYNTYNARTYLQPQLNKACKSQEKKECGDVNPKDFILFKKDTYGVESTKKDNTGNGEYLEDTPFPTLTFPSDHGVLSAVLQEK